MIKRSFLTHDVDLLSHNFESASLGWPFLPGKHTLFSKIELPRSSLSTDMLHRSRARDCGHTSCSACADCSRIVDCLTVFDADRLSLQVMHTNLVHHGVCWSRSDGTRSMIVFRRITKFARSITHPDDDDVLKHGTVGEKTDLAL
ncbi:hypothetical protein MRB53_038550 [Persea americana]|nr:hypothetical protein MRB53_038550 [Persea americana]